MQIGEREGSEIQMRWCGAGSFQGGLLGTQAQARVVHGDLAGRLVWLLRHDNFVATGVQVFQVAQAGVLDEGEGVHTMPFFIVKIPL